MISIVRSRKLMLTLALTLGAAACLLVAVVFIVSGPDRAAVYATVAGLPTAVVAAVAAVLALAADPEPPVPPEQAVEDWVIDRPAELGLVVAALTRKQDTRNLVAVTTALTGAGGFGKTTLAKLACADSRVRHRFRGQVYLVTIGRDVRGPAAIAAKVNDVIKLISAAGATFTDPEQAGQRLGSLLDQGPRRLLVLDDIWHREQLEPFTTGGKRCARLITTRIPSLAGQAVQVPVDEMSPAQAQRLLTQGLPPLDPAVTTALLDVTGNWPLLLRLANKILAATAATDRAAVPHAATQLAARLRADGPAAADQLLGLSPGRLNIGNPKDREQAVQATIDASRQLLDPADAQRFAELAVFAEDETVPAELAAALWNGTADLSRLETDQVCTRLADLALITISAADGTEAAGNGAGLTLHDVVRDLLRAEAGPDRLTALNQDLLAAISAGLPAATPAAGANPGHDAIAWWKLQARQALPLGPPHRTSPPSTWRRSRSGGCR